MAEMTCIKIRGKRTATAAEKWHARKKPKLPRDTSLALRKGKGAVTDLPSWNEGVAPARRRKLHDRELSCLDQLPTEILQDIFEFSGNLDLPSTSPGLYVQLSSSHMHMRLTSRLLDPVLGVPYSSIQPPKPALAVAARLLECKFVTWPFYKKWLEERRAQLQHLSTLSLIDNWRGIWELQKPARQLLPPQKLLRGPFTDDKMDFLTLFEGSLDDIPSLSPIHGELATEGLSQAITETNYRAVTLLLNISNQPSTEMLRQAVCDYDCHRHIVSAFLMRVTESNSGIDLFDPALWSWAEKARRCGDENGEWLLCMLKGLRFSEEFSRNWRERDEQAINGGEDER